LNKGDKIQYGGKKGTVLFRGISDGDLYYNIKIGNKIHKYIEPRWIKSITESITESIVQIGSNSYKDIDYVVDTKTGKLYADVIDGGGNRRNPISGTIDDLLKRSGKNWKWTKSGKEFYNESIEEAKDRDYAAEYQARKGTYYKKYQSSDKAKKYRAELNQYNRKKGTYGNGDGLDASHKGGKIVGFETENKNRSRKEKSRLKKEDINENRWLALKNDESMHPHKKLSVGLKELRNQLHEVEKFLGWYNKIKNINELDTDNYWKRTNSNIYKIKERIINIARTLKEIES